MELDGTRAIIRVIVDIRGDCPHLRRRLLPIVDNVRLDLVV